MKDLDEIIDAHRGYDIEMQPPFAVWLKDEVIVAGTVRQVAQHLGVDVVEPESSDNKERLCWIRDGKHKGILCMSCPRHRRQVLTPGSDPFIRDPEACRCGGPCRRWVKDMDTRKITWLKKNEKIVTT